MPQAQLEAESSFPSRRFWTQPVLLRRVQDNLAALSLVLGGAAGALVFLQKGARGLPPVSYVLLGSYLLVNIALFFEPRFAKLFRRQSRLLFVFNVACLAAFVGLSGVLNAPWYLCVGFIVVLSAMGHSQGAVVVATLVVAALYSVIYHLTHPEIGFLSSQYLLENVFFLVTGVYVGHLADTSRRDAALRRKLQEIASDNTELRRLNVALSSAKAQVEEMSLHDPLTGAANRRGLQVFLERERRKTEDDGAGLVALLVDLDDFKSINESLGHAVGDIVLQEVVQRIQRSLRSGDYLARIGGDEFLVVLPATGTAEGMGVAERIRLKVSETTLELPTGTVRVTASVGVTLVTPHTLSPLDEILAQADILLRRSKRGGKNRVHGIDPFEEKTRIADWTQTLRKPGSIWSVSQSIIRLSDEREVGYELLSRTNVGHFKTPADLFHACLKRNLLTSVDLQCLKRCLDKSATLPEASYVHVNLFPSTLLDVSVEDLLRLFPSPRNHGSYCIEISEQQLIGDPSYLLPKVRSLRTDGAVEFALDDVGFGRSCLESLLILEPEVVKIDRRVIHGIAESEEQRRVLGRLLHIASDLGARVIAEGIERREDLESILELSVPYGQGFLWGKPA